MKRLPYFLLFISINLQAQIPQTLSYQGLLTNSSGPNAGLPVTDGSYSVTFNFYIDSSPTRIDFRTVTVTTSQGLFATVIGNGVAPNQPLNLNPPLGSVQYYIGLQVNGETELLPRVALTSVPYAFTANSAFSLVNTATISGSQLNSPITNSSVTLPFSQITGTLGSAQLLNGSITNEKLATGIDASKITSGTISVNQLADLSITDAKLIGISASKVTGTLTTAQYDASSITNEKLAADIDASKITAGTLSVARLADGSITNEKLANGIDASKITSGTLSVNQLADVSIADAKLIGISASKVTGTLSASQIGSGSIDNSKLASDIDASKLTTGTIPVSRLGVILPGGPVSSRPASAAEGTLRYNSDDKKMEYFNGVNWYYTTPKIAVVKDAPLPGTSGGASSAGWQIRNLNVVEGDNSFVSLTSNRFTLTPGEYIVEASSPGVASNVLRVALVNTSNLSEAYYGTSEFNGSASDSQSSSFLKAFPTLTASTSYEIRFYVQTGKPSDGLGKASSVPSIDGVSAAPNELYTQVKITKLR